MSSHEKRSESIPFFSLPFQQYFLVAICKSILFRFLFPKKFIRATIAVVATIELIKRHGYGAGVFFLAMVLGEIESDTSEEGDTNKVAKSKSILSRIFFIQIGILVPITVEAIKLIQRHGYGADAFLLLFISNLGVLAVVLGHIGSSQNRTLYLKIYLILTYISMSIRFVTTNDKLSEVFYYEDDVPLYKICKAILETVMPFLATIITLPLIRKLSSSSICHNYKNE